MATRRCAACGAAIDGDVCDARCEAIATDAAKWRGQEPCEDCLEERDGWAVEPATVGAYCTHHAERRNEAASERRLEDFYGGAGPQTVAEHQRAAYALK